MPSREVLDFAEVLATIPGENPTGADLRADPSPMSDFQKIREARKAARAAERLQDVPPDSEEERKRIAPPDWGSVLDLGTRILASKSKDLEITAYLIEALVRLRRFPGLRDGYQLARRLVEDHWDGLYPPPEDSDTEMRFKLLFDLSGLGSTGVLAVPIRKIPLTAETTAGCFNAAHYYQARSLSQVTDANLRKKKIDEGAVTLDMIQKAVAETPASFYADLVADIAGSREEFRRFCEAMGERSGYAPPSSDLDGVLDSYLQIVNDLARDKVPKVVPTPSEPVPANGPPQGQPPVVDPSIIKDRADAMDRVLKVAAYFREHEPQSIIPYALEQVVQWSRLSLPELLTELIPDEAPRKNLYKQVGIRPPETKK
jgi:type VI secretion system protein ImpA